ncbi:hypothetical protein [Saccharopolyspora phatthalungensis]|uniref:Uncharacterized protein n=1 Tax=Saccharopolyspora phatthalungensis TaxID=664693 RepID=A0A840Q503_9PSEU|nr:hypothetical protein [Saccharopolyspora phatthalungensis]MBB5157582.1 hypothetical protein [Saccharopolyspora phatthalungensis]
MLVTVALMVEQEPPVIASAPEPHHEHAPYIVTITVVAPIEAAGVEVAAFDTEGSCDDSARNANLQLAKSTLAAFVKDVSVFLGWSEEDGWYCPDQDAPHRGW